MLQFIPNTERAVAEMCRVVRPDGIVVAAVRDSTGSMTTQRMFWDAAAALDPGLAIARDEFNMRPMTQPHEMKGLWTRLGLKDVEETKPAIPVGYACFEAYWVR